MTVQQHSVERYTLPFKMAEWRPLRRFNQARKNADANHLSQSLPYSR